MATFSSSSVPAVDGNCVVFVDVAMLVVLMEKKSKLRVGKRFTLRRASHAKFCLLLLSEDRMPSSLHGVENAETARCAMFLQRIK